MPREVILLFWGGIFVWNKKLNYCLKGKTKLQHDWKTEIITLHLVAIWNTCDDTLVIIMNQVITGLGLQQTDSNRFCDKAESFLYVSGRDSSFPLVPAIHFLNTLQAADSTYPELCISQLLSICITSIKLSNVQKL